MSPSALNSLHLLIAAHLRGEISERDLYLEYSRQISESVDEVEEMVKCELERVKNGARTNKGRFRI